MDKRKAGYILLLMLALPGLALPVSASTGNPISNFASNLLLIVPPVLFIMSILALRKADYDYAFTLLLASIIVTVALSAFQTQVNSYGLLFYSLGVNIYGPGSTTVGSQVTYKVALNPLPAGWTEESMRYNWSIYYNTTELVYSSSGYENPNYVSNVQASDYSLSFTPKQVGVYLITYNVLITANVSGVPGYAIGGVGTSLQVNPYSLWNWITSAVVSAIENFIGTVAEPLMSFVSTIGQSIFNLIAFALITPTVSGDVGNIVTNIYNELIQISISLSLLMIGATVAYNALKNNYSDIIDIASDLFYKIGVWLLFTFGGLEIYNYVAIFVDSLIYEIVNPYLPLIVNDIIGGTTLLFGIGVLDTFVGLGFAQNIATFLGDLGEAMLILTAVGILRYFVMMAIVTLIPLLSTLWIFEWTRKIADMLVDVLIALILAGLLNAIIITLVVASNYIWLLILLPVLFDVNIATTLAMTIFSIRPHERIGGIRSRGGSGSGGQQPPNQNPQSPQTPPVSPQNVPVQNKSGSSPITYI